MGRGAKLRQTMATDPTSLERLHDVLLPPAVPWWPPAPGWEWVLGGLAVAGLVAIAVLTHRWQSNRYRREALAELRCIEKRLDVATERENAVAAMAGLLKRCALSGFPRAKVAALTGPSWAEFLDRTGRSTAFSNGVARHLSEALYPSAGGVTLDESTAREVTVAVRHWIRSHRSDQSDADHS